MSGFAAPQNICSIDAHTRSGSGGEREMILAAVGIVPGLRSTRPATPARAAGLQESP